MREDVAKEIKIITIVSVAVNTNMSFYFSTNNADKDKGNSMTDCVWDQEFFFFRIKSVFLEHKVETAFTQFNAVTSVSFRNPP